MRRNFLGVEGGGMSHEREHDRNLLAMAGELLSYSGEVSHTTQLYRVNPAKLDPDLKCFAPHCRSEDKTPVTMQYEIDHFKTAWIYLFCEACSPKNI